MRKSWMAVLACVLVASTASAQVSGAVAEKGRMIVASNGARLGLVYRVGTDGSAQMIIDGKLVSIPASTLSSADGKLTTNLTKSEVLALH